MEKNKYSVGVYARLSVDHIEKKESLTSQIEIAKEYLIEQEEMELYRCYIDFGESGTSFKRPGFLQLIEDIRTKKINCVIVKDFSRFGRNYLEVGTYIDKIFPFLGVRFISIVDGFDSDSQKGTVLDRNLKSLIDETYAYDTARKVREVKKLYQQQGNYIGSYAPYGYRIERKEGKRILVLDQNVFKIIEKILQFTLEGKKQKEIITWLYQNRVYRPSDYRRTGSVYCIEGDILLEWQRGSIQQIVNHFGVKKEIQQKKLSVGEKFFEGWQNQKEEKIKKSEKDNWKGLLYCGDCKQELSVRKDSKRKTFFCYRAKRIDVLQCKKKQITDKMLSTCISLLLKNIVQRETSIWDKMERKEIERYIQKKKMEYLKKEEKKIQQIEGQILFIQRKVGDYYRDYQLGKIKEEIFLIKKIEEKEKIERLKRQKEKERQKKQERAQQVKKIMDEIEWFRIIKRIELFEEKRIIVQLYIKIYDS